MGRNHWDFLCTFYTALASKCKFITSCISQRGIYPSFKKDSSKPLAKMRWAGFCRTLSPSKWILTHQKTWSWMTLEKFSSSSNAWTSVMLICQNTVWSTNSLLFIERLCHRWIISSSNLLQVTEKNHMNLPQPLIHNGRAKLV